MKKYGIGIFAAVMLTALSLAYYAEYRFDQKAEREAKTAEKEAEEQLISAQGKAEKEEIYYLAELNGYVVVYLSDKRTVYEYTDIPVEELPEDVRAQVREKMKIEGTDKLYGFLENYSS